MGAINMEPLLGPYPLRVTTSPNTQTLHCIMSDRTLCQVDQSISHHDMWDYLELTQKGYSKAFEPVNELLTQVFFIIFLRKSPEMKITLSAHFRDGGRVVQT